MSNELVGIRKDLIGLLGRIIGEGTLPDDLQRTALEIFASLVRSPASGAVAGAEAIERLTAATAVTAAIGNRKLVYVHGICRHEAHFSDSWWDALHPFVPSEFGPGTLGQTRLEVVWSDLVNQAAGALAATVLAAGLQVEPPVAERQRRQAAEEIKEALRDRADQHVMSAAVGAVGPGAAPAAATGGMISIPGINCIDDFSTYLTDDGVRQKIIDRFIDVVRPELQGGNGLDVVSHSWGTVVSYEALRQLEEEGLTVKGVRNFFTVGAALSIGPVKWRLRPGNRDGRKPANVSRWINLNAHGDLVGGPLQGRPYAVDLDFLNLDAVGCNTFLGIVSPACAHGSYFDSANTAVNRDIFGRFVN
jgi:metacaspase-1